MELLIANNQLPSNRKRQTANLIFSSFQLIVSCQLVVESYC